jgi:type II secretory pathway predicted ATPase ExeA
MLEAFGCTREPFLHEVQGEEVFLWSDLQEGLRRLRYGVRCRGLLAMAGPSGSGKTTLLRHFTKQLEPGLYHVLALHHTSGTPLDLLTHLAALLGASSTNFRGRLIRQLQESLAGLVSQRIQPILLVDEAQYLTNQALQELRLLMTSGLDETRLFTLILCGHEDLEGRLRAPWLLPLRQRITTWVRLGALSAEETSRYLAHRLKLAGVPLNLFSPEASFALHQLSSGVLRPLDRLAHHALLACALAQEQQVSPDHVRLAVEEVGL